MLLQLSTQRPQARDLSYLLHKHPDRVQSVEIPSGRAHIFYPQADDQVCTVCLALDINPVRLARDNRQNAADFALGDYVNDRPYVASSYLSVALAKAFSTAMNGTCQSKPELVGVEMPFQVRIAVLPAPKGGEPLIRSLFEPLGYTVQLTRHTLDSEFPEWGDSRYYTLALTGEQTLQTLLSHLYVLIPVLDSRKHYWVSEAEVEKLLEKGKDWLENHPENAQITRRYLKGLHRLTRRALDRLQAVEDVPKPEEVGEEAPNTEATEHKVRLHDQRLLLAREELKAAGAESGSSRARPSASRAPTCT